MMAPDIKFQDIKANGMTFTCRTCGLENDGDLVIFLHGFPETSLMWQAPMKELGARNCRCLAPNLRGYSDGARPLELEAYQCCEMAKDIAALADEVGEKGCKFHVIGQDWGSVLAWAVATIFSERVQTVTGMTIPHTPAFKWAIENNPEQVDTSQYIKAWVSGERIDWFYANDYEKLKSYYEGFPQYAIDEYMALFTRREVMEAAGKWYRARRTIEASDIEYHDITMPALFLWTNRSLSSRRAGAERNAEYMKNYYRFVEIDGGHWMMWFNGEQCTREIVEHVTKFPIK